MLKIAVIIGSTRPGRVGESVAKWVYEHAKERTETEFELVDIKDFNLPLLDEPVPPSLGQYRGLALTSAGFLVAFGPQDQGPLHEPRFPGRLGTEGAGLSEAPPQAAEECD